MVKWSCSFFPLFQQSPALVWLKINPQSITLDVKISWLPAASLTSTLPLLPLLSPSSLPESRVLDGATVDHLGAVFSVGRLLASVVLGGCVYPSPAVFTERLPSLVSQWYKHKQSPSALNAGLTRVQSAKWPSLTGLMAASSYRL